LAIFNGSSIRSRIFSRVGAVSRIGAFQFIDLRLEAARDGEEKEELKA
jgi:hypothetical protein